DFRSRFNRESDLRRLRLTSMSADFVGRIVLVLPARYGVGARQPVFVTGSPRESLPARPEGEPLEGPRMTRPLGSGKRRIRRQTRLRLPESGGEKAAEQRERDRSRAKTRIEDEHHHGASARPRQAPDIVEEVLHDLCTIPRPGGCPRCNRIARMAYIGRRHWDGTRCEYSRRRLAAC